MATTDPNHLDRLTEAIFRLQKGERVEPLALPEGYPEDELYQLYSYFNEFLAHQRIALDYIYALSNGELDYVPPRGSIAILQPFKSLQASLRHLTWVTKQVASGDFGHQVDFMGEFSSAFNKMTLQLKESFETIQRANETIQADKERIHTLLGNVLPAKTISELESTGRSAPMLYSDVVVLMSDIVGFTKAASEIDPVMLIDELNNIFGGFDALVVASGGERIKTIGDAFLAVWGMHTPVDSPAVVATDTALKMIDYLKARNDGWLLKWDVRIGIHLGNVVGGIVGSTKFIYDIFGDAVNMAARLESHSEPMRVNVSQEIQGLIQEHFTIHDRGCIDAKGKGSCHMYFAER